MTLKRIVRRNTPAAVGQWTPGAQPANSDVEPAGLLVVRRIDSRTPSHCEYWMSFSLMYSYPFSIHGRRTARPRSSANWAVPVMETPMRRLRTITSLVSGQGVGTRVTVLAYSIATFSV